MVPEWFDVILGSFVVVLVMGPMVVQMGVQGQFNMVLGVV